jgi:ABC-2 type transport system permease protein
MTGIIVQDTLRSNWKTTMYWSVGMGILGLYVVVIASSSDILEGYGNLMASLPPAMLSIFGVSDASLFTTVEGFVSSVFVNYAMLMFAVYAVMAGLNITANEEDDGIMDILLALPVSRTQVIVEKTIAYALLSFVVILFSILYPVIGIILFNVEADIGKIALSILNTYPGILLIITVTSLIATIAKRKFTAVGLSAAFVMGSYFVNFLGEAASETFAATLRQFSFFYHTSGTPIILDAYNPVGSIALLVIALICVGLSTMMFNRRDVGL